MDNPPKVIGLPFMEDMVRKILARRKIQTRRVLPDAKQPLKRGSMYYLGNAGWSNGINTVPVLPGHSLAKEVGISPGDLVYVRETWRGLVQINCPFEPLEYGVARYIPKQENCKRVEYRATTGRDGEPYKPSIHMPRWASRLTLVVEKVYLQRLQHITEQQAIQEGADQYNSNTTPILRDFNPEWIGSYRPGFQALWDSLYGTESWDRNPWVVAIGFRTVEANVNDVLAAMKLDDKGQSA